MKLPRGVSWSGTHRELRYGWGGRFEGAHDVNWHEHVESELVMVQSGRCRIEVAGQNLVGEEGSLFVLPAGLAQFQTTLENTRTIFVGFQAPAKLFNDSARVLPLSLTDPALRWMEQLGDAQLSQPPLSEETSLRLLELLLRRIGEIEVMLGTQAQQHRAVTAAIKHLEQDLAQPLQLGELASQAGVSSSHLGALFAAQCGCSPMLYLQRRRLERACWLLDNPYLRIHEVAAACGYEDVNYFVRLFRQRHGQSPGRWRKARLGRAQET